jgi:hypothetical protein
MSDVSSPVISSASAVAAFVSTRFACVNITPFGREVFPLTARHQILELEDPVVVPQILLSHRNNVLQVGKAELHSLEQLQAVLPFELLGGDHDRRLGIPEHELKLVSGVRGVQRDDHRTQVRSRQRRHDELGPVREVDGYAITLSYSQIVEGSGQGARLRPRLPVGERLVPISHQRPVGRVSHAPVQQVLHCQA